jgi:hypothetical protein
MSGPVIVTFLPFVFPFFFVGLWLLVTTILGLMSGWFGLQQWYADDGSEEPLLKLRGQSARMGFGVQLNNCLTLKAYQSGLGISIWRFFSPFQKPLKVPWGEIEAEPSSSFFMPMVKLQLGKPSNGTIKVSAQSWSKLVAAAEPVASVRLPDAPPVDKGAAGRALLIQWVIISAFLAAFIFLSSSSHQNGFPPFIAFALVAGLAGIALLVRFARS